MGMPGKVVGVSLAVVGTLLVGACSHEPETFFGYAYCSDFQVGAELSARDFGADTSISGEFSVLAQSASDFAIAAYAMTGEVVGACRGIAEDLGARGDERWMEDDTTSERQADEWCARAIERLVASGASASTLSIETPRFECETSVGERARCQAQCTRANECNVERNPPACQGGTLLSDCNGTCTASAGAASFDCFGRCDRVVQGSCASLAGIECEGRCVGTCKGADEGGVGTGIRADGTCDGLCEGTCSAVKAGAACDGPFDGQCSGACTPSDGTSTVECSGSCTGKALPVSCKNGTLTGGCPVEPLCDAHCGVSVNAKAQCELQPFSVVAKAGTSPNGERVAATLGANLPSLVMAVGARGEYLRKAAAVYAVDEPRALISDPEKVGRNGTMCLQLIGSTVAQASRTVTTSADAGAKVLRQIGL